MTSKKQKIPSIVEHDEPSTGSVYDFLYYDTTRIASFLSQFDPSGHLTEVTQAEQIRRSQQTTSTSQLKSSVAVVSSNLTLETETDTGDGKESHRTYDPRWANALTFLDYIDKNCLLHRNVQTARIGQIVLFSGDLMLFDLGMLRDMWKLPTVKKSVVNAGKSQIQGSNRAQRRADGISQKETAPTDTEIGLELLSIMPHSVQASVSSDDESIWTSLREDSLTIAPSDLILKHGVTIEGHWNIVGILDAHPTDHELPQSVCEGSKLNHFASLMAPTFIPVIRQLLGRPDTSYGFTPLLLFREISA